MTSSHTAQEQIRPSEIPAGAVRISVGEISLTNFRNYSTLALETGGQSVVLTGHNGAGKTNLLEAVSLLSPGRGLRRSRLSSLDRRAEEEAHPWAVSARVQSPVGEVQVGTGRDLSANETDKRTVRVDGKTIRGHAQLSNYMSVVWLTPQMDQLFLEGQTARRRFLDRLVFGFDGEHASRVYSYEYAMRERNRLLSAGRADPHWMDALEQKMAEKSVAIAAARAQTVQHINEVMLSSPLSFPKAEISVLGAAEDAIMAGATAVDAEEEVYDRLRESRERDGESGRSSVGAHRTEVLVQHCEKQMEAEHCSTGEQKALLLAIVLAEARAGAIWHARVPIVLLDEVVAHLDPKKREELYMEIQSLGAQVWMTGTDKALFNNFGDNVLMLNVNAGTIA